MEKRLGTLSIFIENENVSSKVNEILHEFRKIVISRMGTPYREKQVAVIVVILNGTTDEIGALSGKLGNIKGISVKSAISKIK
ncbi:TM1266 family iron-only hydrogenase system putative regulator [Haliovirga abyssi]|uniref:CopG family transcriptional regulator n=1 Tax=Haliovirga abyssi TaxID=2996794 RepID=A0AAU9DID3_9FUSO|nr:TM1266 family iron-only hydrogenase system putative regulator [Haliovirga abyssi]BDU50519.1 CopG family transcriptional regulator [Haliovirga abyssi]